MPIGPNELNFIEINVNDERRSFISISERKIIFLLMLFINNTLQDIEYKYIKLN